MDQSKQWTVLDTHHTSRHLGKKDSSQAHDDYLVGVNVVAREERQGTCRLCQCQRMRCCVLCHSQHHLWSPTEQGLVPEYDQMWSQNKQKEPKPSPSIP